jgi:glycosyltransferase 2 family protein
MTAENARPGGHRRAVILVKLVVSAGLLTLLLRRAELGGVVQGLRHASPAWIGGALALYGLMLAVSAWRWQLLLRSQGVACRFMRLVESFLVATFFNNFLPSNVGGDVVRIRDTAPAAGSKTLATTVVLIDRGVGLLGLFLVAAIGATISRASMPAESALLDATVLWAGLAAGTLLALPLLLAPHVVHAVVGPLRRVHPEWIDERLDRLTTALVRFRRSPGVMAACFAGAIVVQGTLILFYYALARGLNVPVGLAHLALLVPVSFVVQMAPVSINGFGVREATFGLYFRHIGLPLDAALLLSLGGAAAMMAVSVTGAAAYVARIRHRRRPETPETLDESLTGA